MSKDPVSAGKSGLLSKVVRFVSSPTTHWADLDRPQGATTSSESRLALKEMIERKRRNDFVRHREFDLLRKLRRREISSTPEPGGLSSFATSSQFVDTGGRARTLEKIAEIEKQMSSDWLPPRGESGAAPMSASSSQAPTLDGIADQVPESGGVAPMIPINAATTIFQPTEVLDTRIPDSEFLPEPLLPDEPVAESPEMLPMLTGVTGITGIEGLASARSGPEIEEAAIRFANGDAEGAETGLLGLLREVGLRNDQDTWLTLFDLYRAKGDHDKFDDVALDFAGHFGRSAPQWTLEPEIPSQHTPLVRATSGAHADGSPHWSTPSSLGVQSVAALGAVLEHHAPPWRIDWSDLVAVDASAVAALAETLKRWADTPEKFEFIGADRLKQLLVEHSPDDDRTIDPSWWSARLALLRLMNEMDDFELAALKYCVTYEVSPPAWQEPRCVFVSVVGEGEVLVPAEDQGDPFEDAGGSSPEARQSLQDGSTAAEQVAEEKTVAASGAQPAISRANGLADGQAVLKVPLRGEILGSADAVLGSLEVASGTASIEFNCLELERVDFSAAGTLLNWATEQQAQGRQIVFKHVNRLVAAFFGVVGISEVARVRLRRD